MLHKIREVAKDKCGVFSPKQNVHICRILDIKRGHQRGQGSASLGWSKGHVRGRGLGVSITTDCTVRAAQSPRRVIDSCSLNTSISQAVGREGQCLQPNQSGSDKQRSQGEGPTSLARLGRAGCTWCLRSRHEPLSCNHGVTHCLSILSLPLESQSETLTSMTADQLPTVSATLHQL